MVGQPTDGVCRDQQWQQGGQNQRSSNDGLGDHRLADGRCQHRLALDIELLALADRYYASSDQGLQYLSPRCALGVNAARRIYSGIGTELARANWDPRAPRAVVPHGKKLAACARALWTVLRTPLQRSKLRTEPAPLHTVQHGIELISL